MIRLLSIVCIVSSFAPVAAAQAILVEKKEDAVAISIDGHEFTTLHTAKSQMKPYFWPVRAADGTQVARALENPEDHPHHKGIWCAIDEVNDVKFWAERGKIVNESVKLGEAAGKLPTITIVNHWLDGEGHPLLRETTTVTFFPNRLMIYDARFAALEKPVTFGDTKKGMFGIRLANSMRGQSGGTIVNAEGQKTEKECWGRESKWVDYYGPIEGKTCGVALFDDPANFRKSRFHVRNYGLFTLSPFGQSAYTNGQLPPDPFTLEPGKSFRLRYGLYVHEGDTEQGNVAEVYKAFLKGDPNP